MPALKEEGSKAGMQAHPPSKQLANGRRRH